MRNSDHGHVESWIAENLLPLEQIFDLVEQIKEVYRVPIVGTKSLPQEQDRHVLILGIRFLGAFTGVGRQAR